MQYKFIFDEQKNLKLKKEREISFEDILTAINNGNLLDVIPHHNKKKYPNQMIMVVEIEDYIYLVPYIEEDDSLILKTIFKSRKFTKIYLGGDKR